MIHNPWTDFPGSREYLVRPRIDALLDEALRRPLVTLTAGAGCGKTSAVYSFLHRRGLRTIWIQLSSRDNMEDRFWENFTQAVSVISRSTAERLLTEGFPGTTQKFERYLTIPLEDIDPQIPYTFVFDDLHLVHDPAVLLFLEHSITTPFPNITTILIGRKPPALNLLPFVSKDLLTDIGEEELRFTRDEMEACLALQGFRLPQETLDEVYRDTEGWPFAVRLAALCLKRSIPGVPWRPQALRSNIHRLLEREVMEGMQSGLRQFLIKLSLIGHIARELAEEIANLQEPQEEGASTHPLIRMLEDVVSFIRFDTYGSVYRIHPLFLDYLRTFQGELPEEEKRKVYLHAGDFCIGCGLKLDAISYYGKAGAYDALSDVVYTLPMALPHKTAAFLLEILRQAPPEAYARQETFYIILTRLLFTLGRFDEAEETLRGLIHRFGVLPSDNFRNRLLFGSWYNLGFIGRIRCPWTRDYSFADCFEKGFAYWKRWGETIRGPMSVASINAYACKVGVGDPRDIEAYIAAITRLIPPVSTAMGGCMYGMDSLCWGELAFFRIDLDQAELHLRKAVSQGAEKNQYEIESQALFYLLRVQIFQGDLEGVQDTLGRLEALIKIPEYLNRYIYDDLFRGWFSVHIGQEGQLAPWIREKPEEEKLNPIIRGQEILLRARAFFRERNYGSGLAALEQGRSNLGVFLLGRIEMGALEAVCHFKAGALEAAYQVLGKILEEAAPGGLFLPFAELGRDMRALASQALRDKAPLPRELLSRLRVLASSYGKKYFLLTSRFAPPGGGQARRGMILLSPTERETLGLLFQGFTQNEIASSTSRSANTVKSVIKRIYEKLGALNRADAIRIAISRGLLGDKKR